MSDAVLNFLQEHTDTYITELAQWASVESFTEDHDGLGQFAAMLTTRLRGLGLSVDQLGPVKRESWRGGLAASASRS
jgi:hypothetical protein